VPAVSIADLSLPPAAEGSAQVATRVAAARAIQKQRYAHHPIVRTNAEADGSLLEERAGPNDAGRALLTEAAERIRLSARGYHRIIRVARTLADLDVVSSGGDAKAPSGRIHIAEALSYRRLMIGRGAIKLPA